MARNKSERHHWWPECVSAHWANEEGGVHWLLPNGEIRKSRPHNFGVIGNGHFIKLANNPGDTSPWDHNYESEFQNADSSFPSLIDWLINLCNLTPVQSGGTSSRFQPIETTDDEIRKIVACIISLAIRSPINRESSVSLAEKLRGPLGEWERNSLIGANMHRDYKKTIDAVGTRGKFVVINSPKQEFIFGDGFFHNLRSPMVTPPMSVKIFTPITPNIGILFVQPMQYRSEAKLFLLEVTAEEAVALNQTVQVYAKNALFFRSQKPVLLEVFTLGEHRMYIDDDNPIDRLIKDIPGIFPRGPRMPF